MKANAYRHDIESQTDKTNGDPIVRSDKKQIEIDTFAKCNAPTVHSGMKKK